MNKLVYWKSPLIDNLENWIKKEHPHFLPEWDILLKKDLELSQRAGFNRSDNSTLDRKGKFNTIFHTQTLLPWIPFKEYPRESFSDCMFESAQLIADKGKTIDFFWSGGLDSTSALLTFNELGLHKQLHIIIGGKSESSEIFEKFIKGRIDYTIAEGWDDTSNLHAFYGIARPDKHVLCSCNEFDIMFGGKAHFGGRGVKVENPYSWKIKRRYYTSRHAWNNSIDFKGDWVDIDNYMPFVMQPPLEKWLCNHVINENIIYYDPTDESWNHKDWFSTGFSPNAPGQEHYKKCKMPLRDFLYMLTKDEYISYHQPKVASSVRLNPRGPSPWYGRIHAITNNGDIVTNDNFYDFDWTNYIIGL